MIKTLIELDEIMIKRNRSSISIERKVRDLDKALKQFKSAENLRQTSNL